MKRSLQKDNLFAVYFQKNVYCLMNSIFLWFIHPLTDFQCIRGAGPRSKVSSCEDFYGGLEHKWNWADWFDSSGTSLVCAYSQWVKVLFTQSYLRTLKCAAKCHGFGYWTLTEMLSMHLQDK